MLKTISELDDFFLSYMPTASSTGSLRDSRLERMDAMLKRLGNPERSYKTIHLAGSKGKGTTASILAVAINCCHKCGLYRSPHVYDVRERFTLSGAFFPESDYIDTANEMMERLSSLEFRPTTFELYTAYAYLLFKNAGCEYAVIETGLGGRLDATNTIESIMEILLPIEMEHTDILGDTIEKISVEKSKIIKRNSIVVISDVCNEAYSIFEKEAQSLGCPIHSFKNEIRGYEHEEQAECSITSFSINEESFTYRTKLRSVEIGKNYATATLALKCLGLMTSDAVRAMEALRIEGRFEERKVDGRKIVLDVAHTKHSMENLVSAFNMIYERNKTAVVYSSVAGKNYEAMLSVLLDNFNQLIITKAGSFKKSEPEILYAKAMEMKKPDQRVYLIHDEKTAYEHAIRLGKVILITGSFYLVGEFGGI